MTKILTADDFLDEQADEAADALRAHEEAARRQPAPIPQACHQCGHAYAGVLCPLCKEERPAYTALKRKAA